MIQKMKTLTMTIQTTRKTIPRLVERDSEDEDLEDEDSDDEKDNTTSCGPWFRRRNVEDGDRDDEKDL